MKTSIDPEPGDKDHAWIDFENKIVEVDGKILPITKIWGRNGILTEDFEKAVLIQAGKDNYWMTLRLLKIVS